MQQIEGPILQEHVENATAEDYLLENVMCWVKSGWPEHDMPELRTFFFFKKTPNYGALRMFMVRVQSDPRKLKIPFLKLIHGQHIDIHKIIDYVKM